MLQVFRKLGTASAIAIVIAVTASFPLSSQKNHREGTHSIG